MWALLRLLDLDAWGDRSPPKLKIPPQLARKVSKEIMRDMSGAKLFKDRHPQRVEYEIAGDEWALYEAVTEYVRDGYNRAIKEKQTAAGFLMMPLMT